EGFPLGTRSRGLAQFHEARRQCPVAVAGLDGPFAQQHLVLPDRNGADYHARILIVDGAAAFAHIAHAGVVRRNAPHERDTALRAEALGARSGEISEGAGKLLHAGILPARWEKWRIDTGKWCIDIGIAFDTLILRIIRIHDRLFSLSNLSTELL